MTDFRARGTIMGPAGLTAVFGMGTGGAPRVWSPESGRGAIKPLRPQMVRDRDTSGRAMSWPVSQASGHPRGGPSDGSTAATPISRSGPVRDRVRDSNPASASRRRQRVGVVKPFGC